MGSPAEHNSRDRLRRTIGRLAESAPAGAVHAARCQLEQLESDEDPVLGSTIGGFRVSRLLGKGGMGSVYVAEQIAVPGRQVALKVLPELIASPVRLQRFMREVDVVGRLDHPNIVPILTADLGASPPHFAMKLLDGGSLRDAIENAERDPNDFRSIATMIRDLAGALDHAHAHGVIHRDVKPGNIVFAGDGTPVLVDFGLARDAHRDDALTVSSDALGTQNYMAPEQVDASRGAVNPSTDVYGLGITLYECLTGRTPFAAGSRVATLTQILHGDARPPRRSNPKIPMDLQTICLHAIDPVQTRRYSSADAFRADLDAFLAHQPIAAAPIGWTEQARRLIGRHRRIAAIVAAAALVSISSWWYWAHLRPRQIVGELLAETTELASRRDNTAHELLDADDRLIELRALPTATRSSGSVAHAEADYKSLLRALRGLDRQLEQRFEQCLLHGGRGAEVRKLYAEFCRMKFREELNDVRNWLREPTESRWERRVRLLEPRESAALLDPHGRLDITCPRGSAEVWLCARTSRPSEIERRYAEIGDADARPLGRTPLSFRVFEGAYVLRGRLEGCRDVELPWVVRRAAVQDPREQRLSLEMRTDAEIGHGFAQVHAGFSLLGRDDPDRNPLRSELRWIDGFSILADELRLDDLVTMTEPEIVATHPRLEYLRSPRPDYQPTVFDGRLNFESLDEVWGVLDVLNESAAASGATHYFALPTPSQWERAARGADGRVFPWGDLYDRDRTLGYWNTTDVDMWRTISTPPDGDVSAFGVRNMAGSLHECCLPTDYLATLGFNRLVLRGGSYMSRAPEEQSVVAGFAQDPPFTPGATGLRPGRFSLPKVPDGPARFIESFSYPDGPIERDQGWFVRAESSHLVDTVDRAQRTRFQSGALHLNGFAGSGSPHLRVWKAIRIAAEDRNWALRGIVQIWAKRDVRPPHATLRIGTHPLLRAADRSIGVAIDPHLLSLETRPPVQREHSVEVERQDVEIMLTMCDQTITASARRLEDGACIGSITERVDMGEVVFRYVSLELNNYSAPRAVWSEVELRDR